MLSFANETYDMAPALRAIPVQAEGPPTAHQGILVREDACALWEKIPRYVDLGLSARGVIQVRPGALRRFVDLNGMYQFLATHLNELLPAVDDEGCCHCCRVHPEETAFYIDTTDVLYQPQYTEEDLHYVDRLGWEYSENKKCFHQFFAALPRKVRLALFLEEVEEGGVRKFERAKAAFRLLEENPYNLRGLDYHTWKNRDMMSEVAQDYYAFDLALMREVVEQG